jgi:flavin reductase (DIM6/NTAB) family NADH-FMN oxidoreductase RutF
MAKAHTKTAIPVDQVRRYLEPGPIVLVSSRWKGRNNVMTMGWHMVMGEDPALVGCYIWDANHSFDMVRHSRECVINVPTLRLARAVVGIGNCSGRSVDKFATFGLTASPAAKVAAPLIAECHANFECRLVDTSLIDTYSLFVLEVLAARAAKSPRWPETLHYRGGGLFMVSGPTVGKYRRLFKQQNL